ncbi:MAG: MFS transporter [Burkholderiales bacterium]|nr:MAG: MFS transporter [Burkholderiales bacterium]
MTTFPPRAPWLRLFLPFAAGYLLSYLYRTSNAVIGPVLARDLSLPDHALGLLTSTYFLAFGAAQLPLGILLDRFGSRRVESLLLLVAASGAAVFAMAADLAGLAWGRALIGLGVSACLMAAFKAFNESFPPDRQGSLIGWIMAAGGLGAVFAAQPLEAALGFTGWRDVMLGLAAVTVLVSAAIWLVVPDSGGPSRGGGLAEQLAGVRQVMTARQFWRYAPMVMLSLGGFMAVQGLWVSRWMAEVEGFGRAAIAGQLTLLNGAFLAGCLFMGFVTTPLLRRGISEAGILNTVAILFVLVFAAINAAAGHGQGWLWALLAFVFPISNIAYPILTRSLPLALSGRANTALNLAAFAGAFGLQWGMGVLVDGLRALGWSASESYRATFALLLALQVSAVAWMLVASRGAAAVLPELAPTRDRS